MIMCRCKFFRKQAIAFTVLTFILVSIPTEAASAANDKLKHMGVSALLGASIETYLHYKTNSEPTGRVILAATLGSFPGLAKEVIDSTKRNNHFSGSDMAADLTGAFLGALLANFINNAIYIHISKSDMAGTLTLSISF